MAENLGKRPSKGILKSSSSFEKPDAPKRKHKETKWDEMNIIATLHPADKDYGHMKIEEPKTPYNWDVGDASGDEPDGLDAKLLAEKIRLGAERPPKGLTHSSDEEEDSEDEEEEEETPERRAQRQHFESKRKAHYNEYYAVKLARKLMESEVEEETEMEGFSVSEDEDKIVRESLSAEIAEGTGVLSVNDNSSEEKL